MKALLIWGTALILLFGAAIGIVASGMPVLLGNAIMLLVGLGLGVAAFTVWDR